MWNKIIEMAIRSFTNLNRVNLRVLRLGDAFQMPLQWHFNSINMKILN